MTQAPPQHPHLQALFADAQAVRSEAARLRDTLSEEQLTWRPDDRTWSVAQVFEHLRKMDKGYARVLPEAIERAKPGADVPFQPSTFGRVFIWAISPDTRMSIPSPPGVRPDAPDNGAEAVSRFLEQQAILLALMREADGKDLNTGRFGSPITPLVRLTLGEGLTIVVRHEQRHVRQIYHLTRRPDFPSA